MKPFRCFKENKGDRGAILFIVAASLVVLIGFLGLAFDLGHMYVNKSQLQNMADALALAGATALNGTTAGINLAADRASDVGGHLNNKTEFNSSDLSVAISKETDVTFAVNLNGPYYNRSGVLDPANTKFVRVLIPPQPTEIVFAKIVPGIPSSSSFGAEATAGQRRISEPCEGLDPFSAARLDLPPGGGGSEDLTGHFGYVIGGNYAIDYGGAGSFRLYDPTGGGRPFQVLLLQGYPPNCNGIGSVIAPPAGVASAVLMQARFDQDQESVAVPIWNNGNNAYMQSDRKNFRRIIRVALNDGTSNVVGFGCFFMGTAPDPVSSSTSVTYIGSCNAATGAPVAPDPIVPGPRLTQLALVR